MFQQEGENKSKSVCIFCKMCSDIWPNVSWYVAKWVQFYGQMSLYLWPKVFIFITISKCRHGNVMLDPMPLVTTAGQTNCVYNLRSTFITPLTVQGWSNTIIHLSALFYMFVFNHKSYSKLKKNSLWSMLFLSIQFWSIHQLFFVKNKISWIWVEIVP